VNWLYYVGKEQVRQ